MQPNPQTCLICQQETPAATEAARIISGGVCPICYQRLQAQDGVPLRDFLDSLPMPILAVDSDVVIAMGNKALQAMAGKSLPEIGGRRGGDVFECAYAKLPGGCGRTVHCSGCAIRRAVTETFATGRSVTTTAYLNRNLPTQFLRLALRISTEKVWNTVLLRIDHIGPAQGDPADLQ